jgi:hypothetical protein
VTRVFSEAGPFTFWDVAVCWWRPHFFCLALARKTEQGGTMPGKPQHRKSSHEHESSVAKTKKHPIRVVPMHPGAARVAEAVAAQLTYRGGPLLTAVQVFTIFWGAAWQDTANSALMTKMNQFFDYVLMSPLMDQLGEYSVDGQSIGHGTRTGTTVITSQEPESSVQDSDIQNLIAQGIADQTLPASTANSLYFVFVPNGVQVVQGGGASCQVFCGYHDSFAGNTYYAVMPYPSCSGCRGVLAAFDALTSTTSHELCEAVTDPVPGQGWYDDNNGEIGDICAWKTKKLGNYTVQLEWSNQANACV